MTAVSATSAPTRRRALTITLWVLQVVLGLFFIVASGAPKLFGQVDAVETFRQIGGGDWYRYLVGVLEVAGGLGLLIPRLAGLAALGLAGVMVGAAFTQAVVLAAPAMAIFPAALVVVFLLIAWGRAPQLRALFHR